MLIKLINKGSRNQLYCFRKDGSIEIADLGPRLPYHDIAHYVVERHLRLSKGFYGNIYSGYSVIQLSDKNIIKTLPVDSLVAEIITRDLQSIGSGACNVQQFTNMISEEFAEYSIDFPISINENGIYQMFDEYKAIISKWEQLNEGQSLDLNFEIDEWVNN